LTESLKEKSGKLEKELVYFGRIESDILALQSEIDNLKFEVENLYVFGPDQEATESLLSVSLLVTKLKTLL
jgi:hypothetical protein